MVKIKSLTMVLDKSSVQINKCVIDEGSGGSRPNHRGV